MQANGVSKQDADALRIIPIVDRWFLAILVATIAATPLMLFLPLAGPLVALATPVRRSRGRMIALWTAAGLLSMVALAPFVIALFDVQIIHTDPPVRVASPA